MVKPSTAGLQAHSLIKPLAIRTRSLASSINPSVAAVTVATILSISSFAYFFTNGMTNVYGDGIAHVNIARKVVDSPDESLWQRYMQIGSPWLPLQTVLMLPLVTNDWMWRTGAAGSAVSMAWFVIAALALYLLARSFYRREDELWREILPAISAGIFVLNPGVLYMQSTPMSELVFMGALVTAVYFLQQWSNEQSSKRLVIAAAAMTLATLSRYEAWPVAALSVPIVTLNSRGAWKTKFKSCAVFSLIVSLGPLYWLWHNWAIYGNALEFFTGPNSARGIFLRDQQNVGWTKAFVGNIAVDALVMAAALAACAGGLILLMGVTGFFRWVAANRKSVLEHSPVMLLAVPFFFHVFSLYRGEIQVFPLSAFGLHNVRYGVPHLLAAALFAPGIILLGRRSARPWVAVGACALIAWQYGYLISDGPSQLAVYQEGFRNGVNARAPRERARVSSYLKGNPPRRLILMHSGGLGPLVSQGGLRFADVIHEGTSRWHQLGDGLPSDVETVILEHADPLDMLIRENGSIERALTTEFKEAFSVGEIRVFRRSAVAAAR